MQLPLLLRAYISFVVLSAVGLFSALLFWEPPTFDDLGLLAFLLLCGAVVAETSRGFVRGLSGGFTQDLNTIWKLPILLILPPALALPATLFLTLLWAQSVRKSIKLHRRAFNVAMMGVGDMLAAFFFQASMPTDGGLLWFVALGVVAGVLTRTVNHLFLAGIILITRSGSLRRLVLDREVFAYAGVEICVGLIVALLAVQSALLVVIAVPPVIMLHRSLLHEQLRNMSRTDAKTEVLNAGAWEHDAKEELARAKKAGESTSVLLCDIDHFKLVNDEHGHLAGDTALRVVAQRLKALLRQGDILGRFGGEEFVILLSGIGVVNARSIAERLRRNVAADPVSTETGNIRLTVSLGVATLEESDGSLAEMMAAADEALYAAKRGGRNQVVVARKLGNRNRTTVHDTGLAEPQDGGRASDADATDGAEKPAGEPVRHER
ncbi:MAG: diguanylate cyclase [Streptosporangiales bacterium]|nr:diguanylate cyclase [Streptosporangiales bacterium]